MAGLTEPLQGGLPVEETANGCFETMRAYGGRIFRLEAHLDRLVASAAFLGTRLPGGRERLARSLNSALARSGLREAVVRIALFPQGRGPAEPSIVVRPAIHPPAAAYRRGLRVAVVPARKFSVGSIDAQSKYSARLGSVLAVADAQLRGVDEAIFMDETGSVTESTASNLGIVRGREVRTPPCWMGLLSGITREALFELGPALGLTVRESPLTRHELYNADEAFMTSTLKEVIGVTEIDGRRIGDGRPGPVTRALRAAFAALVRKELGWRK
jgi:branched-chain amino acid aminotransferase